jgi:hypothetical protein
MIGVDDIYGQEVERGESWWVADGRIHHADEEVVLYGINWFGLDASARALYGPANAKRSVGDFLSQLKSLGFNALRVPLSPESIRPGFASESWTNHGQVDTGREHFDALLEAAASAGMYMLPPTRAAPVTASSPGSRISRPWPISPTSTRPGCSASTCSTSPTASPTTSGR